MVRSQTYTGTCHILHLSGWLRIVNWVTQLRMLCIHIADTT